MVDDIYNGKNQSRKGREVIPFFSLIFLKFASTYSLLNQLSNSFFLLLIYRCYNYSARLQPDLCCISNWISHFIWCILLPCYSLRTAWYILSNYFQRSFKTQFKKIIGVNRLYILSITDGNHTHSGSTISQQFLALCVNIQFYWQLCF